MTTIAERIKENRKRSRPIESQPEDIIYQNQDQDSNLTPQQKGRIFEEQCQELIRSQGITCTLSQASRWNKGSSHQRKYTKKIKYDGYELIILHDHGIDAYGHSGDRRYIAQFKNHKAPISSKDARDFIGVISQNPEMIGLFIAKNGYSSNAILEFEASNQPIIYETHIPTNLKEILTRSEPIKTQLRQTIVNEGGIYIRRTDGEEIYFNNVQINEAITY